MRLSGQRELTVVVAARRGALARVAAAVDAAGGAIQYRDDGVDYLRAGLPIDAVETFAANDAIEAIDIDAVHSRALEVGPVPAAASGDETALHQLMPERAATPAPDQPPPGPNTPRENPYLPTRDIGAPQFIAANPTFDGRGVTIAILDHGAEVLVPELQEATTLDGRPTTKIVEWRTVTDPRTPKLPLPAPSTGRGVDASWVSMQDEVTASGGRVTHGGKVFTTPRDGRFRIGLFDERTPNCYIADHYLKSDVNRDGNPPGSSGLFGVLWDEAGNTVWVDTNQNLRFDDERAMTEYHVRFDVATFGVDDPRTPVRETVPFVINADPINKFVNVGITNGIHGSMVTGTAAGRGYFGGAFDGVAPGAQIVALNFNDSYYYHTQIEAFIYAAKHPKVDVISLAMGVGGALNDGTLVFDVMTNRLVEIYGKPFFISAANAGPGINTVQSPANADRAMSTGAYFSRGTLLVNFGMRTAAEHYLASYSARGPREDGALKPDFVTPTGGVTTLQAVFPPQHRLRSYDLPVGYQIGGGTSQASPFGSGAAALLISAARQRGVPHDAERIRRAIATGARFLPGYAAHEQGSGLLQVGAAWDALQKMRDEPIKITTSAPVATVLSAQLATPHRGRGLYEREGWTAGQEGTRNVSLRRSNGPRTPLTFPVRWAGNDGTFTGPESVTLAAGVALDVPVKIRPRTAGVHSAIMLLLDPANGTVVHQVLHTVVAAEDLSAANQYRVVRRGEAERPRSATHFVRVPDGAAALHLTGDVESGTIVFRVHAPTGVELSSASAGYQEKGTWSLGIEAPMAGVWEVVVENAGDLRRRVEGSAVPLPPAAYTLTARAVAAAADLPAVALAPSAQASPPTGPVAALRFTSRLAEAAGKVVGSPLGTVRQETVQLTAAKSQQVYDVTVPPGADRLEAATARASDEQADVDLYAFDCSSTPCRLRAHANRAGSGDALFVTNPSPGRWRIVLDAYRVPSSGVTVEYTDLLTHAAYGRIDIEQAQGTPAEWRAQARAVVDAAPRTGRRLVGLAGVIADGVSALDARRRPDVPFEQIVGGYDITRLPFFLARTRIDVAIDGAPTARR